MKDDPILRGCLEVVEENVTVEKMADVNLALSKRLAGAPSDFVID